MVHHHGLFFMHACRKDTIKRKKAEQMATGKMKAEQFGITSPEAVFTRLAEVFSCAAWEIRKRSLLPKPQRVNCVPLRKR